MHKKIFNALYVINIVAQAFFDLVFPIALMWLFSYLLTEYVGVEGWIYAPMLIIGVFVGLISMVKFILTAMSALERLEREQSSVGKENGNSENEKQK